MRLLVGLSSILLAVGCGDDGKVNRLPDAPPPPDGAPDAPTVGMVSLTVQQDGEPTAGVRVLFQNADSTVVSDTTTGTDGKASAVMESGGYVTAIDAFGVPRGVPVNRFHTFAGVEPGDELQLVRPPFDSSEMTVTFDLPVEAGAAEYRVHVHCRMDISFAATPGGQATLFGCGATSDVLAETLDINGEPVSFIFKQNVALADNGTVDLTGETYAAVPAATFTYSNLPASTSFVFVEHLRSTATGPIRMFNASTDVSGGAATVTTKLPSISGAAAATMSTFLGAPYTQHTIVDWGPAIASYTFDGAGAFLPEFSGPATLDTAAHAITWTTTGGSAQPDFVRVRAFIQRDAGGTLQAWDVAMVAPPGTRAVLPVIPDSPFNPMPGDESSLSVELVKVPGGYDAVRAHVLSLESHLDLAVGTSGRASVATLSEAVAREQPPVTPAHRGFTRRVR